MMNIDRMFSSRTARVLLPAAALLAVLVLTRQVWIHARAQTLVETGWERMRAGNLTGAISTFHRAQDVSPGSFDASRGLGEAYFALWHLGPSPTLLNKAEAWYGNAILTMPADLTLKLRLLHVRAMRDPADVAFLREALDGAGALARKHPGSLDLQDRFLSLTLDIAMAGAGREMVLGDPRRRETVAQAAHLLLAVGGFEGVLRPLLKADLLHPAEMVRIVGEDDRAAADLARYLLESAKWAGAREEISRISLEGGLRAVPLAVAEELRRTSHKEEAVALLKDFLGRRPNDAAAGYALAETLYGPAEKDWAAAEPLYRQAMEAAPEKYEYRRQYGIRLIERKEYGKAAAELHRALSMRPDDDWTLYYLGKATERLGYRAEARAFYTRAVFLDPNNQDYRKALAGLGGG